MPAQYDIRFHAYDSTRLVGTLTLPENRRGACPIVIVVHGAQAGTRGFFLHRHLTDLLLPIGVGTFIYDRRGEGASSGDAHVASFDVLANDVIGAIAAIREQPGVDASGIGLWALSQGGWIAPLAAARSDDVAFLAAVSPCGLAPSAQMTFAVTTVLREAGYGEDVVRRARQLRELVDGCVRTGEACDQAAAAFDAATAEPWFEATYVADPRTDGEQWPRIMDFDVTAALAALRIPVLLVHGEHDRWVPLEASIDIWRRASERGGAPLSIARIRGAGHAMTTNYEPADHLERGAIASGYEHVLVDWLRERVVKV